MLSDYEWDYAYDIMQLLLDVYDPVKHIKKFDYNTLCIMYKFTWDRSNTEDMQQINSLVIDCWYEKNYAL